MVANIHCKSHDNYSERNWHPPAACVEQATRQVRSRSRERGRVRLAWTASISLYRTIRSTKIEVCNRNINARNNMVAFYSCKTSTHRSRSDTTEGFHSIENKIFPTMTNKNKPRSDLRDAKQRAREIRSTYPCRSHSGNVHKNVVGVVVLASPPRDPIQSKRHNGQRLRALHTYRATMTPPPRSSKAR
jgi:hypothetical protein